MDIPTADQYFELALDLPDKLREQLLDRLTEDDPALAADVRQMVDRWLVRGDFATQSGVSGTRDRAAARQLDALHHVAVPVADIAAAIHWYRQRFAFEVEYEDATWALLRFANFRVALVLPEQHPSHICVLREDAASFGELRGHRDGTRSVYTTDPWGNAVEVLDSRSLPAG